MAEPLVSVVVPSYNRAQYIAETLESVLAQTYPNIEIIVIDDGSTDDTREVVERYAPRVRYVWQENAERGAARNHGLRLAAGEFVAFLDSDDLWLPQKVEGDLELLRQNPDAGVVYSDTAQMDADGRDLRTLKRKSHRGRVTDKLLEENFVSIGAHLIRTDAARAIGGFRTERELSGSEDWEFWVRLSTTAEFVHRPEVSVRIRTFHANTMGDAGAMNRSMSCAVRLMEESDYLTAEQKRKMSRTRAMVSLVNAINYCTAREVGKSAAALKDAAGSSPAIVLDPRFGYTVLRLLLGNRISTLARGFSSR